MGASNTLADYLVSIRTKKHTIGTHHSSSRQRQRQRRSKHYYELKPHHNNTRRSLAKEIWNTGTGTPQNSSPPISNIHKRKHSYVTIDTTETKRTKTETAAVQTTTITSGPTTRTHSKRIIVAKKPESRVQTSKLATGCTLQPHFTKDHDGPLLRLQGSRSIKEQDRCIIHQQQYRFEFPTDLLDNFSMNDVQSYSNSCGDCSIISQITQDSSLDEEEDYAYSSEEEGDDDTNSNDDEEDEDDAQQSSDSSSYHHHFEESTSSSSSRKHSLDAKLSEVKEGAKMLLDLLSMQ
eukprot:CAMPEP_0113661146 /NCGR_PEP_ID=MMETSP0017_2-20120614/33273_1 /TAXON_ID=2856 /ORGANISM="Cylindrotheca closterium" /LENGTH=291 /DNA_ID=CAMNT_0000575819 /DNA_START=313 /DNA_END=1188 /DNA_ORIENTATION=- /assembly_acc=CAM_ASM_000147